MPNATRFFALAMALAIAAFSPVQAAVEKVTFEANGLELSGLLSTPSKGEVQAMVIIVHGYGSTNVVEGNWYFDLRASLAAQGVATFVWDKPGCGESAGEFDPNQPVQSSAAEVVAAAAYLRERGVPGADRIGLWGVSRAGWIAPLAMAEDSGIDFWISVSGVDALESFGYLLQSNWRLLGYPEEKVASLYEGWLEGNRIVADGGAYSDYFEATRDVRADSFFAEVASGSVEVSEQDFAIMVANARKLDQPVDAETGLAVYVEGFDAVLSGLDVDVLAIFGRRDSIVDWRSTRALYADTIGRNPESTLSIKVFEDGNHNLHRSESGSFTEMLDILNNPQMVDGYFDTITEWMRERQIIE